MENKRVTLKMIAEKAGVSIGTVDRAINNRGGISPESCAVVLKVAQELGYRPNKFASALSRKKLIRICIAFPIESKEFYEDVDKGIDKASEELNDYGVQVDKLRYSMQDFSAANEMFCALDPDLYDGYVINAAGINGARVINKFSDAGKPVITFNTDAANSSRLFFVGNNSHTSGLMAGELLSTFMRNRGNVAVFGNFARISPFIERFSGFCEYMQLNCPEIMLYPCPEMPGSAASSAQSLIELLSRAGKIGGIFCTGNASTINAIQALSELDCNDIYIVGYDVTPQTILAMQNNKCNVLLYQNPYQQGYQATMLMSRHILEDWMPAKPFLRIDTRIIIKSNLKSCINEFKAPNVIGLG